MKFGESIQMKSEEAIYDDIMAIYHEHLGVDDPVIYHKLVEIVNMLKNLSKQNPAHIKEIVSNALVLILTLFFNKKNKDFDDMDQQPLLTPQDRKNIKQILGETWNIISSQA